MIVDYAHLVCIAAFPAKANPVLLVDPDAVLILAITRQFFQPVARQDTQIFEVGRIIEIPQPAHRYSLQAGWQLAILHSVVYVLCNRIAKALDHPDNYGRRN